MAPPGEEMGSVGASFTTTTQNGMVVVAVRGDLDVASADSFQAALAAALEAGDVRVVVDLAELAFIDSSGLGALIRALKRARERGGGVRVENVSPTVRRVFEITGLVEVFDVR